MHTQYTHDIIFAAPHTRISDMTAYVKYIIESRQIDTVFLSNSELAYAMLPSLSENLPAVTFIDYVRSSALRRD